MLNKKNKRIIRKIKHYIHTFPLSKSEIQQMEQDITGMALEAEQRGEEFTDILDMTPSEFCNHLVYSLGGCKAPGGRRLLKYTGIYYQLIGLIGSTFSALYFLLFLLWTIFIPSILKEFALVLIGSSIGVLLFGTLLSFGNMAEYYCNITQKSTRLITNGKLLLFIAAYINITAILCIIFKFKHVATNHSFLLLFLLQIIITCICYIPANLYIIGAKRNLPCLGNDQFM